MLWAAVFDLAAAAEPLSPLTGDHRVGVAFGVGGEWGLGGSTAAWAPAVAERVELSGELTRRHRTWLGVALRHSRPDLGDAGALLPDSGVGPDAFSGWRDELGVLATVGVPVDAGWVISHTSAPLLRILPTFGVEAGFLATDAHLSVPAFASSVDLRSRAVTPLLGARLGAELRLLEWVSLVPISEFTFTVAPNPREQSGGEQWDVEGHVSVGIEGKVRL